MSLLSHFGLEAFLRLCVANCKYQERFSTVEVISLLYAFRAACDKVDVLEDRVNDHFSIITTLVTGFGLALVFGWLAERFLKTPALVGYIIAGVAVSLFPLLPPVDHGVTQQFAEIGVMLLMFGVGLHFSVADLVKVKGVAVTGALLQMTISASAGTAVALLAWSWSLPLAIVFGMTLSCASTVVVMKALELRRLTSAPSGQVAIGWLVVQDLVTVFIMVCLPILAQVTQGSGPMDPREIVVSLSKTMLGLVIFVASMLIVGRRVFPWILQRVALAGSRELFTLCVLAIAIGIAYGAGAIFNVSFALGAFFAGMVMRESSFAHRAAKNCLPLQDAFAVLFFVSVGLMLDLKVFVEEPLAVIGVVLIIMVITSSVSAFLVMALGWPLDTALVLGACVSQLGEFSFILCGQGIALGIASERTMSLIVAASIMTIALNPLMFAVVPRVRHFLVGHGKFFRKAAMRDSPLASKVAGPANVKGHVVIAEVGEVIATVLPKLEASNINSVCFVPNEKEIPDGMNELKHCSLIVGDPSDPILMVKAHVMSASLLVLPSADTVVNQHILTAVRGLKEDLLVIVRVVHPDDIEVYKNDKYVTVICDVAIASTTLANLIHETYGLPPTALKSNDDDDDDALTPEEQKELEEAKRESDLAEVIRAKLHQVKMPEGPKIKMPEIKVPPVKVPKIKMPKWHLPKFSLPEVSISIKKKTSEAPKSEPKDVATAASKADVTPAVPPEGKPETKDSVQGQ